ncbi:MAG: BrnA antitoxin family protein [bacterium]|nr:BrnA antitoxin family protein [bacterium]
MTDEDIDYSDIPPTTEKEFSRAELRFPKHKETVTIQLDSDVLAWFKTHNKEYHAQINTVLRRHIEAQRIGNY